MHYYIGVTTMVWALIQAVVGLVVFVMYYMRITPTYFIKLRLIHRWSGYVLVVLCKIQTILGWFLYMVQLGVLIVSGELLLFILTFVILNRWEKSPIKQQYA
jgi:hypothetical protein